MDRLFHDLKGALRALRRTPGFTLAAVLTLALGIGANTAIFSVLDAVVLRPLPLPESHRLVNLGWNWGNGTTPSLTAHKFTYWREHSAVLDGLATYTAFSVAGPAGTPDEGLRGLNVSEDFFRVVGLQPALGRGFTREELQQGGPRVVVLSDPTWRSVFGGEPGVVGRDVELNGTPHTVVGVMPESFRFPYAPGFEALLRPLPVVANPEDQGHNSAALGRLRSGVTHEQARADLERVLTAYRAEFPQLAGNEQQGIALLGFHDLVGGAVRGLLWILFGAIGFVLLIACANVANLMLARATERQREIAVRMAIGAGRRRVVQQILTESMVVALLAAALGVALAVFGVGALLELSPEPLPRQDEIGVDLRVLAFTLAVACLTGITFGLATALPASRTDLAGALKHGGRNFSGSSGSGRVRSALVATQTVVAVVLLSGAGLLIATFANLRSVDAGFNGENLVVATFSRVPPELGSGEAIAGFQQRAVESLGRLPGVQAVTTTNVVPFSGQLNFPMTVEGRADASEPGIQVRLVGTAYFETLQTPVVRGRPITETDRRGGAPVILINEATARHYFPDRDPVGERIQLGAMGGEPVIPGFEDPAREIVGVVADLREIGLRQAAAARTIYLPQAQAPEMLASMPSLLIRTARPDETLRALPEAIRALEPGLPAPQTMRMTEIVGLAMSAERFAGTLLGVFAAIALFLTAIGIYAVIAYTARQHTREIGVRLALGAKPVDVLRLITGKGMRPVVVGAVIGVGAALATNRVLAGVVFGIETHDPTTFATVIALLMGVALAASALPARRATRVDPVVALRNE